MDDKILNKSLDIFDKLCEVSDVQAYKDLLNSNPDLRNEAKMMFSKLFDEYERNFDHTNKYQYRDLVYQAIFNISVHTISSAFANLSEFKNLDLLLLSLKSLANDEFALHVSRNASDTYYQVQDKLKELPDNSEKQKELKGNM